MDKKWKERTAALGCTLACAISILNLPGCTSQSEETAVEPIGASAQALAAGTNVTWSLAQNLTVTGANLTKSGGAPSLEDGRAFSAQSISGDGELEFVLPEVAKYRWIGLTKSTSWKNGGALDYGFRFQGGNWEIYENGTWRNGGSAAVNDKYRVSVASNGIRYYRNGALVFTNNVAANAPVYVNASFIDAGGAINAIQIAGIHCGAPTAFLNPPSAAPTSGGATIRWTTPMAGSSQVSYGVSDVYQSWSAFDATAVTSHSVTLSGLSAATTYRYKVYTKDSAGNVLSSKDGTFRTP